MYVVLTYNMWGTCFTCCFAYIVGAYYLGVIADSAIIFEFAMLTTITIYTFIFVVVVNACATFHTLSFDFVHAHTPFFE